MDTLYMKLPQKRNVYFQKVTINDVAEISCTDLNIESRIKALVIKKFSGPRKQRIIISVNDLINKINDEVPSLSIVPLGEVDCIIEYIPKRQSRVLEFVLVAIVCIITFFGSAFTIMTFNNDVTSAKLFQSLYEQFTGIDKSGFNLMELSYCIGLPLGILVFFNHFTGKKITIDPTPLETEMKQYEYTVNKSLIAEEARKEADPHGRNYSEHTNRPV